MVGELIQLIGFNKFIEGRAGRQQKADGFTSTLI